jgi:8-oxo-dGTP diphosphatase
MHCYLCHLADEHLTLIEHEASRWLTKSDIESVKWLPADIIVVEKLEGN